MPIAQNLITNTFLTNAQMQVTKMSEQEALSKLQIGFELETQKFGGKNYTNFNEQANDHIFDYVEYARAIDALAKNLAANSQHSYHFFFHHLPRRLNDPQATSVEVALIQWLQANDYEIPTHQLTDQINTREFRKLINDLCNGIGNPLTFDRLVREGYLTYSPHNMHRWNDIAVSSGRIDRRQFYNHGPTFVHHDEVQYFKTFATQWPEVLTLCYDGTVQGPEVKPTRPLNSQEYPAVVEALFKNDLQVDTKCSFHVHVSIIGDDEIMYSRDMQLFMTEYVLNHLDALPASLRDRWCKAEWLERYYDIRADRTKYNFIAFRNNLNTWEFRCFGNIKTAEDALKCIQTASKAYLYALKRVLKLERSLMVGRPSDRTFKVFKETLALCLEHNVPFRTQFPKSEKESLKKMRSARQKPGNTTPDPSVAIEQTSYEALMRSCVIQDERTDLPVGFDPAAEISGAGGGTCILRSTR